MIAIDNEEPYTVAELVNPDTVRLMGWYLNQQCSRGLLHYAQGRDFDLEDIVQEACVRLCRFPANREFAVTTIVCKAVFQAAARRANWNRFRGRLTPHRRLCDDMSDGAVSDKPTDDFEWSEEVPFIASDLKKLPVREQFILCGRFGFEGGRKAKLTTLGEILGVTKSRIMHIETEALRRLKHHIELRMQERRVAGVRKIQARRRELATT